ncbi:MAG: fumarylacetoacetate hydrolase family protein, partial [Bacteroidota bacterium]
KNFASTMSPWVVPFQALQPFRVEGPKQEPAVLPYLQIEGRNNYDINLEVIITPKDGPPTTVSRSNFQYMYWNMAQQLAHHTVNGCNVRTGDLLASGTISGKDESSYGSLLEIAHGGRKPFLLADGQQRTFLEDGDTVTLRGYAEKDGIRVGFGEATGTVLPARSEGLPLI